MKKDCEKCTFETDEVGKWDSCEVCHFVDEYCLHCDLYDYSYGERRCLIPVDAPMPVCKNLISIKTVSEHLANSGFKGDVLPRKYMAHLEEAWEQKIRGWKDEG